MVRRFCAPAVAVIALAFPAAAVADSCANISRAAPPCGMACTEPVIVGNWIWLPSIHVPFPAWGFAVPGGEESVDNEFPGANGNYTNGKSESLLGVSAHCGPNAPDKQHDHGIVSGCE